MNGPAARSGIHATAAVFGERGVLILGASGAGKSALALALVARALAISAYGALIGDDRIWLEAEHGRLVARGAASTAGQIEQRPAGVVVVTAEPAAIIHLVVELLEGAALPRFPAASDMWQTEGARAQRLALDRNRSAADNSLAVEERLRLMFPTGSGKTNFA